MNNSTNDGQQQKRFVDKVVIVTGSSSGIGQDAAIQFAKEGASIVIHGQNAERLAKTEAIILEAGVPAQQILKVQGSMEDKTTPVRIVDETLKQYGKINVLVNNAGVLVKPGVNDPNSLDALDYIYAVNLRSVIHMTELAMPHLMKTRGNVVNVSSVVAVRPFPMSYYSVMKAALDGYTKSVAQTYGVHGVRINSINPGPIDTFLFERSARGLTGEALEKFLKSNKEEFGSKCVLNRLGTVAETSAAIKFIASDEASYITGISLIVDGGYAINTPQMVLLDVVSSSAELQNVYDDCKKTKS